MTAREELIQEIRQASDALVEELLKVLMLLKSRQADVKTDLKDEQVEKQTVLERMGGLPQYLLHAGDLSDRDRRRALLLSRIQQRYRPDL